MSERDSGRWWKRLWMVNGILLLAVLVFGIVSLVKEALPRHYGQDIAVPAVAPAGSDTTVRPRAVRFSVPQRMYGSRYRIALVGHAWAYLTEAYSGDIAWRAAPTSVARFASAYGPEVNVIFLAPGDSTARLLFDRPVLILWVSSPKDSTDSLQHWIAYDVVERDTNHNGKLDPQDASVLYLSDLDGTRLRRVLPDGWQLEDWSVEPAGNALDVLALPIPPDSSDVRDDKLPERAFRYDLRSDSARPYALLDSLVDRAAHIVGEVPR
ncbi:MAG TPA: hypothetical protein VFK13_10395 [Gemmatimonadaceae bacterium]|nr:hypothetical protein [Gemmatimonadaceae bacterium]